MPSPDAILQALTSLRKLPLRSIGRATDMLWLGFGSDRTTLSRRGESRTGPEWSLHVQCDWKLCRSGRISVTRQDFYYAPDGHALDDDTWDTHGVSRFDQTAAALNEIWAQAAPCVVSCATDAVGGGILFLTDDYRLDLSPDCSAVDENTEHWRLFRSGHPHFVVS